MTSSLRCPACDAVYDASPDEPWQCTCGHALEFDHRPLPSGTPVPFERIDTRNGLWAFHEFIPIEPHVTLGEGFTPLIGASGWDVQFKLEYVFPTGSFKDRGATTTISRAVELGVEKVIEDSSGNAGASIAAYAAHAGIEADVYVPADAAQSKLMAIQRAGARPVRVEGDRNDVTVAAVEAVDRGEGWYASHAWNPAFYAGTMTFAFEVAAQRNWVVPDAIVVPIGHGTLFLGAYRGFEALRDAGIVDRLPRLLGAQASGYDPIAETLGNGVEADPDESGLGLATHGRRGSDNEVADGIKIREPARGSQVLEAIEAVDGTAIAVDSDAVEAALDRLHRQGLYVEPTAAVAPAALVQYREEGVIGEDEDVVVPLTGSGLKTL